MKITKATENDLSGLLDIFNLSRKENGSFVKGAFSFSEFTSVIEGEDILVARIGGELAGFISVWTPDNFIHHLFVSPKYQGKGVGKALISQGVSQFGLPLFLKCIEANEQACRFYNHMGWQVKDRATGPDGPYLLYYLPKNA